MAIGMILGYIGGLYGGNHAVLLCIWGILCVAVLRLLQDRLPFLLKTVCFSKAHLKSIVLILIMAILANFYMQYTEKQYTNIYTKEAQKTSWEGIVVSEKVEKSYTEQYIVKLPHGKKCYVYMKKGKGDFSFGDVVQIQGTYTEFEKQKNPGGYDARLVAKTKKIVGMIQAEKVECVAHGKGNLLENGIFSIRHYALHRIQECLPENVYPIVQALILGEKGEIAKEVTEDFRKSSLSHMLAISGAHVSYIIMAMTALGMGFSKRSLQIGMMVFLCFFSMLVGSSPSAVRACVMSGLVILASILHRRSCMYTNMAVSILVLGLENPYCLWNLGLQLSYVGTLGIVYFLPILQSYPHMWIKCGRQTRVYTKACKLWNRRDTGDACCKYRFTSFFGVSFSNYSTY